MMIKKEYVCSLLNEKTCPFSIAYCSPFVGLHRCFWQGNLAAGDPAGMVADADYVFPFLVVSYSVCIC